MSLCSAVAIAAETPLYRCDFSNVADGETPKDMVALNGAFVVKTFEGHKVLELPGNPADGYGLLFGPDGETNLSVQARINATSTGKRMPEFGVGLGDAGGYKLWLMPATKELQLIKGDDVIARVPYGSWKSGAWMVLKFQATSTGGKVLLRGKAWPADQAEPKDWMIRFDDTADAPKGRASIWGNTYSSTPIRFDELTVEKAGR